MPHLEMLNIRNLPVLNGNCVIPMDYFVKGIAAMFLDVVNKEKMSTSSGTTSLDTIALGATFFRDVNIGTHHVAYDLVSDFLRFRAYNIDYKYPSPSGLSTVLSEVAKDAAYDDDEVFPHDYLFNYYWLG